MPIIIIIIIKKVKIIVTLSIKNTAGALYKSQKSGLSERSAERFTAVDVDRRVGENVPL